MDSASIAQLIVALGVGGVLREIIVWRRSKPKDGADTAVVLSQEAREWTTQAMERAAKAEQRADSLSARLDEAELKADQTAHQLTECKRKMNALVRHIQTLEAAMREQGLTPPRNQISLWREE